MEKHPVTDNFPFSIINFQLFSGSFRIRIHLRVCGRRNRYRSRHIRNCIRLPEQKELRFLQLSVRVRQ